MAEKPTNANARWFLGTALEDQGRDREAEQQFRTILQQNPRTVSAHYSLGKLFAKHERDRDAEQQYRIALKLSPKRFIYIHCTLGYLYAKQGRYALARKEFLAVVNGHDARYKKEAQQALQSLPDSK